MQKYRGLRVARPVGQALRGRLALDLELHAPVHVARAGRETAAGARDAAVFHRERVPVITRRAVLTRIPPALARVRVASALLVALVDGRACDVPERAEVDGTRAVPSPVNQH